MRYAGMPGVWLSIFMVSLLMAGCSSPPSGTTKLTLNNPYWDRVNVEVALTKRGDCEPGTGFLSTQQIVMRKNKTESFDVPDGATACWRHDRNPNNPSTGDWTGWTRATLQPGTPFQTDI
jgi:hypothetical protein